MNVLHRARIGLIGFVIGFLAVGAMVYFGLSSIEFNDPFWQIFITGFAGLCGGIIVGVLLIILIEKFGPPKNYVAH
jgi:hypothetical protein